jgi:hypothetical protein
MHTTAGGVRLGAAYRERLSPSLWTLFSAALVGPMVALVFAPLDGFVSLTAGLAAGILVVAALVWSSPVVEVRGGELRVGRAHIPVALLGEPVALTGDDAREARGPGLRSDAWHRIRGGIDGVLRVPVLDPDDRVSEWVISTRTPERVAAAVRSAQQ